MGPASFTVYPPAFQRYVLAPLPRPFGLPIYVAVWFAYARKLTRSGHAIYVAPLPAGSIPNSLHFPDPSRPHMIAILLFPATARIWRRARYSRTRNRCCSRILLQITSHGMNYNIATILAVIAILFVLLTYVTGAPLVPVAVILLGLAIIFRGNASRRV
ncbi:MAG: hypothetical protein DME60_09500 [Verrucomicrobia bacterium]|nr:MAG: hypothetical protein DME60_09500 [Verrucomicrobiota bacterium]